MALEPTGDNDELWYDIAIRYGKLCGQLAVYLTTPFNPEYPEILDLNGLSDSVESQPYSSEDITQVINELVAANDNVRQGKVM